MDNNNDAICCLSLAGEWMGKQILLFNLLLAESIWDDDKTVREDSSNKKARRHWKKSSMFRPRGAGGPFHSPTHPPLTLSHPLTLSRFPASHQLLALHFRSRKRDFGFSTPLFREKK
eukprot:scaffold437_cov168-Ochromonas_danica.AAC.13